MAYCRKRLRDSTDALQDNRRSVYYKTIEDKTSYELQRTARKLQKERVTIYRKRCVSQRQSDDKTNALLQQAIYRVIQNNSMSL